MRNPPGRPIGFWRAGCGLGRREEGLGGHIESLPLVGTRRPHCVVVVAQAEIESKMPGHLPVVLDIEIPVGIVVTNKSGESNFLEDKHALERTTIVAY